MSQEIDVAVIGSGPGGYAASLAGARKGLKVCLVEREQVGGVCLNAGCIPTKAMLAVAHLVRRLQAASQLGVSVSGYSLDYPAIIARNKRIVTLLRRGLWELLQREGVEIISGDAAFEDSHNIVITSEGSSYKLHAQRFIIASGGQPLCGSWRFDEERILSYRGLLALKSLPKSLLIIGGGVIGCEFASCFSAFGTKVSIVEQQPQLLPSEDAEAAMWLTRRFEKEGISVRTGIKVERLESTSSGVRAVLSDGTSLASEYCLVSVGIKPNIDSLRLSAASVTFGRGVYVDAYLRTNQAHIAAVGDCLENHGLAHWASFEGALAVRNLLLEPLESLSLKDVPRCVFSDPEIAHVGPLQSEVDDNVRSSRFSFEALGRSHCDGDTEGFVKLLIDATTDRLKGATIVGPNASSLIHYAVLAIRHGLSARQLAGTITAHPTSPELISEAAAHFYGESLSVASRAKKRSSL